MQRFIVPQFIDVEPKIFGPLTVRQFVFVVFGGIIIFLSFRYADISLFLFMTLLTASIVFLFGFLKVNGMFFHIFLLNVMFSLKRPALRVWQKRLSDNEVRMFLRKPSEEKQFDKKIVKKALNKSRLAELALVVDTRGEYKGE
jgi:hypothetical protein